MISLFVHYLGYTKPIVILVLKRRIIIKNARIVSDRGKPWWGDLRLKEKKETANEAARIFFPRGTLSLVQRLGRFRVRGLTCRGIRSACKQGQALFAHLHPA